MSVRPLFILLGLSAAAVACTQQTETPTSESTPFTVDLSGGMPPVDTERPPVVGDTDAPDDTDTDVPDTDIPDTDVPDTDVPDTDVPDTDVPDTDVPDTDVPDTDVPDTDVV